MKKALIFDLEGTLVSSGIPLPCSVELIDYMNNSNIPYCIITNTISKTVDEMEQNAKNSGLNVFKGSIINPLLVLNNFLEENSVKTYYFVGPDYLKKLLVKKSADFEKTPEYVIFCDFEHIECNYELFNTIFQYIQNGAKIVTTSYSNYYSSRNEQRMDTGIFVKMYELVTNEKAVILGKPSSAIYKLALNKLKMEPQNTITVGDDVLTDVSGGKEMGIKTVLVKTGKYKEGDEKILEPDAVINNLEEIRKMI
ncbi:MAG: TIGR01458 family HAD-type hydrolase [Treponemataceae bacterium]|nr:MAG: TIGR01458 family HAD-type hydrolase [Treponemataceae bacterium]